MPLGGQGEAIFFQVGVPSGSPVAKEVEDPPGSWFLKKKLFEKEDLTGNEKRFLFQTMPKNSFIYKVTRKERETMVANQREILSQLEEVEKLPAMPQAWFEARGGFEPIELAMEREDIAQSMGLVPQEISLLEYVLGMEAKWDVAGADWSVGRDVAPFLDYDSAGPILDRLNKRFGSWVNPFAVPTLRKEAKRRLSHNLHKINQ
jgi:hypothetical protein